MPLINEIYSTPPDSGLFHGFIEDFANFTTGDLFTTVTVGSGSVAVGDGVGGEITITTQALDNDEAYAKTTNEIFLIAAGKPLGFAALVKFAQADTNKANVAAGLMNAVAADAIVDDGAGLKVDFAGAAFFTVDGDTTWRVMYSDGTTQSIKELDTDGSINGVEYVAAGTVYQELKILIEPQTATKVDVTFWIDGVLVAKFKDKTYASATEMEAFAGVKAGGSSAEVVTCDLMRCHQKR